CELEGKKLGEFKGHINECPECRKRVGETEEIIGLLRVSGKADVPPRIWHRIKGEMETFGSFGKIKRFSAALALGAAVVILALFSFSGNKGNGIDVNSYVGVQMERMYGDGLSEGIYINGENEGETVVEMFLTGKL
ncbi:MAG: hypothetical protein U9R36_03805, partial [Elusimicrobiota bacterium]|nr:hypothetical protein [Elusimicrobiota bacterium]